MKVYSYLNDVSNYSGPDPSGLWAAGSSGLIAEYTYRDIWEAQIRSAFDAGKRRATYNFLYWSRGYDAILNSVRETIQAIQALTAEGISCGWLRPDGTFAPAVWLDCEADEAEVTPLPADEVNRIISDAVALCDSMWCPVGIYTNEGFWVPRTGNSVAQTQRPLWYANPNHGRAPLPFSQYFTWTDSPWSGPMIYQTTSTVDVGGVSCDENFEEWEEVA